MPRPARHDRQQALDRAVDLFWERGYHATSMKHIEQALDMRPGSLYATFGSKEGLFSEVLNRYAEQMADELSQCLQGGTSGLQGFSDYLLALAGPCQLREGLPPRACMLIKTLLEVNTDDLSLRAQADRILGLMEQRFAAALKQAQAAGEIRPEVDCDRLARLLQAQVIGLRCFTERATDAAHFVELAEDMGALLATYRTP